MVPIYIFIHLSIFDNFASSLPPAVPPFEETDLSQYHYIHFTKATSPLTTIALQRKEREISTFSLQMDRNDVYSSLA